MNDYDPHQNAFRDRNEPPRNGFNWADQGAHVGVQADHAHDFVVNFYGRELAPSELYQHGVRWLDDGLPSRAKEMLARAIEGGLDSAEVRFHWVLAMFSKRSLRDLSSDEIQHFEVAVKKFGTYQDLDRYATALRALGLLFDHLLNGSGGEAATAEKPLLELPRDMLEKIELHLELVLSGVTKDKLWARTKERAAITRFAGDRSGRVWAYFHPIPVKPRKWIAPASYPAAKRGIEEVTVDLCVVGMTVFLGLAALLGPHPVAVVFFLGAVVASVFAGRDIFEWRYQHDQAMAKAGRFFGVLPATASEDGFTGRVQNSFERMFYQYIPHGLEPEDWLNRTAGIRSQLCREISDVYRESRIPIGRVNWLIRHLASEVKQAFEEGRLYDFAAGHRVAGRTKLRAVTLSGAGLVMTLALFGTVSAAGRVLLVAVLVGGGFATFNWYRFHRTRRGLKDAEAEAEVHYQTRLVAYERWARRLDDTRPSEIEMETWLRSDITVLVDRVLSEARLEWRDVITHAVLRGPAPGRVRRRSKGGQWRYSDYLLHVFVVTKDGVREVVSELDFKSGEFGNQSRRNFQLDAISSVEVEEGTDRSRTLGLTLTNGPTRKINVTDTNQDPSDLDDPHGEISDVDQEELLRMNLDAAGFNHALRLLEGIGADGKGWIERNARR